MTGNNNEEDIEEGNKMGYIAHKDGEKSTDCKRTFGRNGRRLGTLQKSLEKREWGYCCGMLHDIGKILEKFQKKIQENTNDKSGSCYGRSSGL